MRGVSLPRASQSHVPFLVPIFLPMSHETDGPHEIMKWYRCVPFAAGQRIIMSANSLATRVATFFFLPVTLKDRAVFLFHRELLWVRDLQDRKDHRCGGGGGGHQQPAGGREVPLLDALLHVRQAGF